MFTYLIVYQNSATRYVETIQIPAMVMLDALKQMLESEAGRYAILLSITRI